MNIEISRITSLTFLLIFCFFQNVYASVDKTDLEEKQKTVQKTVVTNLGDVPLLQHPGGIFKEDPKTNIWVIQCQGCGNFMSKTAISFEPTEKIIKFTDKPFTEGIMNISHSKTCRWKTELYWIKP